MPKKMLPIAIVTLSKLVPGGQAMGELDDGQKCFVWGGLPGEKVEVQITKSKKTYAEGYVIRVVDSPSSNRAIPRDECYLATSPWQIMTTEAETRYKSELVQEQFRQAGIDLPYAKIKGDDKWYEYRNKMEYSLYYDHETARIWPAFHRRGSHQKQPINHSSLERPEIWRQCQAIIDELNACGDEARRYQSLMLRCNQAGEVSGDLFVNGRPHPPMKPLSDSLLGYRYTYSPNGFFQINLPVYEMALCQIRDYLAQIDTRKVVDMYSGVGTIGLSVARDRNLTLVEVNGDAYNEMLNNIPKGAVNIMPIHAKSEEALEYITSDATIIVDPPRAGLDEKVVSRILETLPPYIIYLSCNPATQARDVTKLTTKYKISENQSYNFFPRTPHIESLLLLNRR